MDKMEKAINRVDRYESKLNNHLELIKKLGIDAGAFWASFPAGSEERKSLTELERIQRDLSNAREELSKRVKIENKKGTKSEQPMKHDRPSLWMQSKTGMWHKHAGNYFGEAIASCQSYNLDRINALYGDPVSSPPDGAKICKKCLSKSSGKTWRE
ncbi:hypothetical protein [Paenibacillus sp. NAIST15-1]|uniref:hypothetical protein n=1 Tax=Paenibacillus sp. NAIST15-1 TaxID=1605994 RepID=UPI0008696926|nr:hypothetical protein [Paenibacillus sp. NAIST15-1]GAV11319.1 hypothetical protein PBN151_1246 [Paenibacillus sp. NAIST15-1]